MSKPLKVGRKSVVRPVARPSRIRRDPVQVQVEQLYRKVWWWESREWEIRFALIGVTLFALAISAAVIDIGQLLSR